MKKQATNHKMKRKEKDFIPYNLNEKTSLIISVLKMITYQQFLKSLINEQQIAKAFIAIFHCPCGGSDHGYSSSQNSFQALWLNQPPFGWQGK